MFLSFKVYPSGDDRSVYVKDVLQIKYFRSNITELVMGRGVCIFVYGSRDEVNSKIESYEKIADAFGAGGWLGGVI